MCVCACVCMCVCACVRACVCVCWNSPYGQDFALYKYFYYYYLLKIDVSAALFDNSLLCPDVRRPKAWLLKIYESHRETDAFPPTSGKSRMPVHWVCAKISVKGACRKNVTLGWKQPFVSSLLCHSLQVWAARWPLDRDEIITVVSSIGQAHVRNGKRTRQYIDTLFQLLRPTPFCVTLVPPLQKYMKNSTFVEDFGCNR